LGKDNRDSTNAGDETEARQFVQIYSEKYNTRVLIGCCSHIFDGIHLSFHTFLRQGLGQYAAEMEEESEYYETGYLIAYTFRITNNVNKKLVVIPINSERVG